MKAQKIEYVNDSLSWKLTMWLKFMAKNIPETMHTAISKTRAIFLNIPRLVYHAK